MASYLIPNQPNFRTTKENNELQNETPFYIENELKEKSQVQSQEENSSENVVGSDIQRIKQLEDLTKSLEIELTEQLNNHKLFLEDIGKIEAERNVYYGILSAIENILNDSPDCTLKREIMKIIEETPDDFLEATENK